MAEKYRIGKYEFDTYEEYVRGMLDVKKIYKITHSVDIYDPDIAVRLYQMIRKNEVTFYSKIGRQFFLDLADVVADNAQHAAGSGEGQEASGEHGGIASWKGFGKIFGKSHGNASGSRHNGDAGGHPDGGSTGHTGTDVSKRLLGAVCLVAAVACFAWYFWSDFTNRRGNQVNEHLKELQEQSQADASDLDLIDNTFFSENSPELEAAASATAWEEIVQTDILPEYSAIYQENQDFAGWLTIEGTEVDYPVMLTRADADYYLGRNFNGEDDINGTLFMDARTNLLDRSTNIIIYGHNMKSGQMFGGLKNYLDESYWTAHKQVSFDTIYEKGTYEIFAVCLAQVQYQNADAFRYYNFIQADTEAEFNDFLMNIGQLAVFMSEEQPVFGDELLTLSTCNNFVEDGRLFLVAKRVDA